MASLPKGCAIANFQSDGFLTCEYPQFEDSRPSGFITFRTKIISASCSGRPCGSGRRPPEDPGSRDNTETDVPHRRWLLADMKSSRTAAGLMFGKHGLRSLVHGPPELIFREFPRGDPFRKQGVEFL